MEISHKVEEVNSDAFENNIDIDEPIDVSKLDFSENEIEKSKDTEEFDIDELIDVSKLDTSENKIEESENTERSDIDEPIDISQIKDVDNNGTTKAENSGETEADKGTEIENNDNSESDNTEDVQQNKDDSNENKPTDVDNKEKNQDLDKIAEKIGTTIGVSEYFKKHPDKLEGAKKAIDVLNNPNSTVFEKQSALGKLNTIKGNILESAVKDILKNSGLSVEDKHKAVEGEKGKTLPDVVATNETDKPIEVIGITIEPGEKITIECKCGEKGYLNEQLKEHIPKQLAGHEGKSVLLTTSDIKDVPQDKVKEVCAENDTKQVTVDASVADVNKAIKEAVQQ